MTSQCWICHAIPDATRKPNDDMFYRTGVTGDWSLQCGNRNFRPFFLLCPWRWPDDLHIRIGSVLSGDTPDVQIWNSYVKAVKSYRLTAIKTYRQTSYAWSHPIAWQRWRSHHSIRRSRKPHATRKSHGFIFYRNWVMGNPRLHTGYKNFVPFRSCDLDLETVTFIYELDPYLRGDTPDVQLRTS